ncbi:MAG: imidazolonepropionase [Calditrichaeota bacterium]|nr:imidazolonepropionase [Calditrichota bacterium]
MAEKTIKPDLLIKSARELICPADKPTDESKFKIIPDGAVACVAGEIAAFGSTKEVLAEITLSPETHVIDAREFVVSPGLVDAHTHPVFFGTREHEFEQRNQGKTYAEIAKAGGGIRYSVRQLRKASTDELVEHALPYLDQFVECGTTTIEAKSGYGLSLEDEIKSLQAIKKLNDIHPLDLIPTFLGAHEIPDEYRNQREKYIQLIIEEMIPRVVEENLAEFCDIFCEEHVFNLRETEKILSAALDAGLKLKIHADQLSSSGGAALAARLNAISADHLDYVSDEVIGLLKNSNTVPVLLPGAVFFLGLNRYAPARKMLDAGALVAIATDFNPGSCMTQSLPLMMTIASIYMKMSAKELWAATTATAAKAIDREKLGKIEAGAQADFALWEIPNYRYLPYHFGVSHVNQVIKSGRVIWEKNYSVQR